LIQNIFVFKAGVVLVNQNFGQCHSLGRDINLISSYLYALQQISIEITGTAIKSLNFEEIALHFYKDSLKSLTKTIKLSWKIFTDTLILLEILGIF